MTAAGDTAALRIVLADDHPIVRAGIRALIEAEPDMTVVGEAGDGDEAIRVTSEVTPDILVVDMSMPARNGAHVTRQVRQTQPEVRVIALTVHDDRDYLSQLLKAGVAGYLVKRAATSELIQAIRIVAEGGVYVDPRVAGRLVNNFVGGAVEPMRDAPHELSDREAEVVRQVARGFSNKEIALQLSISVKTVETYKARVIEKLGVRGRADLVRFALRRGWLDD